MRLTKKFLWVFLLLPLLFVNTENARGQNYDEDMPDVTARVARISYLSGQAQIRHADSQDWERVSQNLPIVEGDEIATDGTSLLEIQFNSENYLRLSQNAYLKITTLRDEGVAVSLPQGTLSLRVFSFDKDREFFEIDAPQSTAAVQKAGLYRVDAGDRTDAQIRVTVTEDGQARVYSDNAGFTVHNGRSATLQLTGNYAGEWDTNDASRYADEFDSWSLQRDAVIAKRLQDSYYDRYYDRDIYGAEDLSDYGEWINTKKYGYVWRPYKNATSSYADWSPYRYGQWRWIPYYGWTWVNDEPWGWATYHHGRWIYDNGGWIWTPYGYYRAKRSWWHPALVVLTYSGSLICWYPLPYSYGYYNYNSYSYVDRRRYNTTIIVNPTPTPNPTPRVHPSPTPIGTPIIDYTDIEGSKLKKADAPISTVPPTGVVGVPATSFGTGARNYVTAPSETAKKVLSEKPSEIKNPPVLPNYEQLSGKLSKDIRAENPKAEKASSQIKTGASERKIGASIDEKLRTERIFGDRTPVENNSESKGGKEVDSNPAIRDTGAVRRTPRQINPQVDNDSDKRKSPPRDAAPADKQTRSTGAKTDDKKSREPVYQPRRSDDMKPTPPAFTPPPRDRQPPTQETQPKYNPPPKREEPPRQPPRREEPPQAKPPQKETPRPKNEPKPAQKQPQPENESKGKRP